MLTSRQPSNVSMPGPAAKTRSVGLTTDTPRAPARRHSSAQCLARSPPPSTMGRQPGSTPDSTRWIMAEPGRIPAQRSPVTPSSPAVAGRVPVATTSASGR